ncbi:MAG: VOC family protein [Pseudomonadota bacterium]
MEKVNGIGGVFYRADNPDALRAWYAEHLGVEGMPWTQTGGYTVYQPFARDTDYFPDTKQWMINFRVDDLEAMTKQLEGAGIDVKTDPSWDMPEVGRFARIHDPEGNPIELWEPAAPPA